MRTLEYIPPGYFEIRLWIEFTPDEFALFRARAGGKFTALADRAVTSPRGYLQI